MTISQYDLTFYDKGMNVAESIQSASLMIDSDAETYELAIAHSTGQGGSETDQVSLLGYSAKLGSAYTYSLKGSNNQLTVDFFNCLYSLSTVTTQGLTGEARLQFDGEGDSQDFYFTGQLESA